MEAKSRNNKHLGALVGLAAFLAALLYNNWLLGPIINSRLYHNDGSISEYSVASQPYHLLFQGLDIASSLFLILLPFSVWRKLYPSRSGRLLLITSLVLGIANVFDALLRLPCSDSLDKNCNIPVQLSLSHFQMPSHAYSSVAIAMTYLILPIAGLIFAASRKLRALFYCSLVAITVALVSFFTALDSYYKQGSLSVHASGAGQEIQMLTIGIWLIVAYLSIANWNIDG